METYQIPELIGKTFKKVWVNKEKDELHFLATTGEHYRFYHDQDCCECVCIEDITGELGWLVGYPLLVAEWNSNQDEDGDRGDSITWTFYKFATNRGSVDVRWVGTSNGYYSESVDFEEVKTEFSCPYCGKVSLEKDYLHERGCCALTSIKTCLNEMGYVEMADAIGFPLITAIEASVLRTTSFLTTSPDNALVNLRQILKNNKPYS